MRVITGKYRGLRLCTPDDMQIRPTTDKIKESIFSAIQFDLPNANFLDIFSGTGQMGIEALSRGAKFAVFVDKNLKLVKKNIGSIKDLGYNKDYLFFETDALRALNMCQKKGLKFDVVFMDPPYDDDIICEILDALEPILNPKATVVCEHSDKCSLPDKVNLLCKHKEYFYSSTTMTVYRRERAVIFNDKGDMSG